MNNIKIKVEYVYEKGVHKISEDSYLIGKNIFGVFDGAGSLINYVDKEGYTGGYLASNICKNIFQNEKLDLYKLAIKANNEIQRQMMENCIDMSKKENLWSTTVSAIKINHKDKTFEWIQTGDSLIIVIYKNNKYKVLIKNYDHDSETLLLKKELLVSGDKDIKTKLLTQMLKVRRGMNKKYGVLNGESSAVKFLKKGKLKIDNIKYVLMFTDGLFLPKIDPKLPDDFDKFVEMYMKGGFLRIKKYVRKLENTDLDCYKYVRFKKHDDITGISVTFEDENA
ncbi:MAG: hypothetical protein PHZ07_00935 [Patescibacteria group bacterium]|nr:hypothetical protein [Patescibacteria group bacterium]MDD4304634.1 hypothetical protein [Patescibacteria group bacterium]MDD4695561.1 hypothetical protein [Patescibacteria group bacterium]